MTSELSLFFLTSEVIILERSVLVMNKSQAEKKVNAFHAVFRVDINDVKPFQNPTEKSPFDHYLDLQSMPSLFKDTGFNFIVRNLPKRIHSYCYIL